MARGAWGVGKRAALRLALAYAACAASWIVVSDVVVAGLGVASTVEASILKGFGFVLVTALLLYVYARHLLASLEASRVELLAKNRALARAGRALRVTIECNRALAHATEEIPFLTDVCSVVVEVGQHRMAWIGFVDDTPERQVRCAARAGVGGTFLDAAYITGLDEPAGRGPVGTAIRSGTTRVWRDVSVAPDFAPWREEVLAQGYASAIGVPLVVGGVVVGGLGVYSADPEAFDDEEKGELIRLAKEVGFGIEVLRSRAGNAPAQDAPPV